MKGYLYWTLFLIFLVLKLTDLIDWSWWWVTSPLWIPIALAVVVSVFCAVSGFELKNKEQ